MDMTAANLADPELYINREISSLRFNFRVLAQAKDESIPLLERLRFLFICSSNLDEFFEVRVASIKNRILGDGYKRSIDGLYPLEILKEVSDTAHALEKEIYQILNEQLLPALREANLLILDQHEWTAAQAAWIKNYFRAEILPVISPIGLDLAHPFPRLANKSLNYIVSLTGKDAFGRDSGLAIVNAPRSIPRVIRLPQEICDYGECYVLLSSMIQAHTAELFGGMTVTGCFQFRVTRNSDLAIDEDHILNLAMALKSELLERRYGAAVRLEVDVDCPEHIAKFLLEQHGLTQAELYPVNGPVNLSRYSMLLALVPRPELRYPVFTAALPHSLSGKKDIFEVIRNRDVLLHHPYQSFSPVLDFIRQATIDVDVLAIKLTLYRVEANSPMADALINAARAGKQVLAVVELRARFDEEHNIELATRLQEAGALVVYGVVGFKTHAKMILVIRREGKNLRRYVHLGTGNYHAVTAKLYTDIGLFTYDQDIGHDVNEVFQQLTGMGRASKLRKLLQSPFTLFAGLQELIGNEIRYAQQGLAGHIILKLNALTEPQLISLLYQASQAGVKIELIIRSICCLRPGIRGISENITVHSILGRFLEHSRIYYFYNNGEEKIFASSADLMERNMFHRVEICFPILERHVIKRIKSEILELCIQDTLQAFNLNSDGMYFRVRDMTDAPLVSSQQVLLDKYGQ